MYQLVEHGKAFGSKLVGYRLIILLLNGCHHLVNRLHEGFGLSHLYSMGSHTHVSHSCLQNSLSLLLLRLVAAIH